MTIDSIMLDSVPESVRKAAELIGDYLKREKLYLFTIDNHIKKLDNGIVKVTLRVYQGKVTDIVFTNSSRVKFQTST